MSVLDGLEEVPSLEAGKMAETGKIRTLFSLRLQLSQAELTCLAMWAVWLGHARPCSHMGLYNILRKILEQHIQNVEFSEFSL